MNEEIETHSAEIITPTVMESQTRAEYDVAVATAKRYPRSISAFMLRAEGMATMTQEIAATMEYAKPVGNAKIKGPSVRLAEIVAATYGNLRVQARIISENATQITAQGVAHDLETNVAQSTEVTISIVTRNGKRYVDDQVATMRAAACAKARRNATFLVVPKAMLEPIIEKARRAAAGDLATLPKRRKDTLDWFEAKGAKRAQLFAWLQVKAEEDIGLEAMADLLAARNTMKEEAVSVAEFFKAEIEKRGRFEKDQTGAANQSSASEQEDSRP